MPKYSVMICYDCSSGTVVDADSKEALSKRIIEDADLTVIPSVEEVAIGDAYKAVITNIDDASDYIEINL